MRVILAVALGLVAAGCGPITSPENEDGQNQGSYGYPCAQASDCGFALLCVHCPDPTGALCCHLAIGGMLVEPHDAGSR